MAGNATAHERAQTGDTAPHREANCRGHNGDDDLAEHYARCQSPRLGQLKGDHDTPTASRQSANTTTGPRRTQAWVSDVRKLFGLATTYVCLGQGRALYTPTPAPSTQMPAFSCGFLTSAAPAFADDTPAVVRMRRWLKVVVEAQTIHSRKAQASSSWKSRHSIAPVLDGPCRFAINGWSNCGSEPAWTVGGARSCSGQQRAIHRVADVAPETRGGVPVAAESHVIGEQIVVLGELPLRVARIPARPVDDCLPSRRR